MDQPNLVETMAAKIVCQHGSKSLPKIDEYRQMAIAIGDPSSVQTWRDIGDAVKRLLSGDDLAQPAFGPATLKVIAGRG